ncbi:spore germination protein [Paenibacillus thiaminolyticus]|uniref:spore germination protein n=1 Tax=Paenibacillus thiaminolyticus TaxID=49283 RepID=UPI00232BEDC2|nr:spore germination protein [Paenibacillus thiaminolyticus]WCF11201.1 spore germination protein [Paenibacillus thiaminolyticus]
MPSIVGNIKVVSVTSGGIVHIGDAIQVSPESTAKSYGGSGSFNTGDFMNANSAASATNTIDPDVADSNIQSAGNQGVV